MANSGRLATKSEVIKRRRRDRQIIVFGFLVVALAFISFVAYSVYQGRVESPINYAIVTPPDEEDSEVTLPCPPSGEDAMPMPADQISFRTLNATDETGLARTYLEDLVGRSFVGVQATNWNQEYDGFALIAFGEDGLRQAYTIAIQFPESELRYDNRDGAMVDVILGNAAADASLRPLYAPELSPTLELTAAGPCLPIDILSPAPGPARLPADPLAPAPSPSVSPSVEPAA